MIAKSPLESALRRIRWDDPIYTIETRRLRVVASHADRFAGRLLDIGCGQQPFRAILPRVTRYIGLDVLAGQAMGSTVALYGSAMTLPFPDSIFDSLVCSDLLEHVSEPGQVLAEAARVARPGAWFLLTVPWLWPVHAAPHDYYRYTPYGLRYLLGKHGFRVEALDKTCGLVASAGQRLATGVAYGLGADGRPGLHHVSRLFGATVQRAALLADRILGRPGETTHYVVLAQRL